MSYVVSYVHSDQVLEENKDRAKECGVAGCLVRFVPCSCDPLIVMTLRLLYNLSFDPDIRCYLSRAVPGCVLCSVEGVDTRSSAPKRSRSSRNESTESIRNV